MATLPSPGPASGARPSGSLRALVREDYRVHGSSLASPGFRALAVCRLGVWLKSAPPSFLTRALRFLEPLLRRGVRSRYAIELHYNSAFGRRLRISDQGGIVLGFRVHVGDDCCIGPEVTLGLASDDAKGWPRVGDRVVMGPGAVVVGDVRVGDDAVIGPSAVVLTDVPPGAVVTARPAEIRGGDAAMQAEPGPGEAGLWEMVREDWAASGRSWRHRGFRVLLLHRLAERAGRSPSRLVRSAGPALRLLSALAGRLRQVEIPAGARIGRRVRLPPGGRALLLGEIEIGDDCVLGSGVTIGWDLRAGRAPGRSTRIGSGVWLAPGATVMAGVSIGAGARVGFNAVVADDVPAGAVASAPPARCLRPVRVDPAPAAGALPL